MNITVSDPKIEDIPAMIEWSRQREMLGGERDKGHDEKFFREWIEKPGKDILLVAKDGNTPVGMCAIHFMRDWAYCSELYVERGYRRKGVGRALIVEAVKRLRKFTDYVGLVVNEEFPGSQKFYKALGFEEGFRFRWMEMRIK